MTAPYYPFDRTSRISTIYNGNGTTKEWLLTWKIFDVQDVEVWRKLPGETTFSPYGGASVTLTGEEPATFKVTFPTAPVLNTKLYFKGRRLHERSTAIKKANQVDLESVDRELTRIGYILQELYRETGFALKADPGVAPPALIQPTVDGKLLVGGPGNSVMNGPSEAEIQAMSDEAEAARDLALQYAQQALQYYELVQDLADTVLDASNLASSLLPTIHRFTGDGTDTTFDLGNTAIDERATNVYISGVYQQKNTYSVVAGVLTFVTPPPNGFEIEVTVSSSISVSYEVSTLPEGQVAIELKTALPSVGNFEGRTVYLTTTGKLYTYHSAAWVAVDSGSGGGGGELPEGVVFIEIVAALPETDNYEGRTVYLTSDNRMYVHNGTEFAAVGIGGGGTLPDGTIGIEIVSVLPLTGNFTGRTVYLISDGKLHTWDGSAWDAVGSGVGGGGGGTLPDGATFIEIVDTFPLTDNFEGRMVYLTTDGKLYTFTDGDWKAVVSFTDFDLPEGFSLVEIVGVLPVADNYEGRLVYLTTDHKLWRYIGDGWSAAVDAEDLIGQITSTQITDGAITTPKILAGAITAAKLAVNSVLADNIQAGAVVAAKIAAAAITGDKIAANAVSADKIQAGAVTAAKIAVTQLSAISAVLGAVDISMANIGSLTVNTINLAGNAVTVQAAAETAGSVTINGGGFTIVQSIGITWGAAASMKIGCHFRCTTNEDLELDIRNNGASILSAPIQMRAGADLMSHYIDYFAAGAVPGTSGTIGFWLRRATTGTAIIRNRKLGVFAAKR